MPVLCRRILVEKVIIFGEIRLLIQMIGGVKSFVTRWDQLQYNIITIVIRKIATKTVSNRYTECKNRY